jgi:hypothetical protein
MMFHIALGAALGLFLAVAPVILVGFIEFVRDEARQIAKAFRGPTAAPRRSTRLERVKNPY